MPPEPTNLLPDEKIRAFRRGYFFRLLTLAAASLVIIVGIHAILLLPTHLILSDQIAAHQEQLAVLASSGASADATTFQKRLTTLSVSVARIGSLSSTTPAAVVLTNVLSVPRVHVSLTGLSFAAASGKKRATVTLAGIATARDDLRQYQILLQGAPFVGSADLPVSTYAKDVNIPFIITVSLASP